GMTASSSTGQPARFLPLEQADFQRLEHGSYLKGLLQPFKGKGRLEAWANQCTALRDDLIGLAQRRVLQQARAYPFSLLDVQLASLLLILMLGVLMERRWRQPAPGAHEKSSWRTAADRCVSRSPRLLAVPRSAWETCLALG